MDMTGIPPGAIYVRSAEGRRATYAVSGTERAAAMRRARTDLLWLKRQLLTED